MAKERAYYLTINISDLPEVVRLTEEAKKARRPIRLTIDDQEAGVLVPPKGQPLAGKSRTTSRQARGGDSKLVAGFGAVAPPTVRRIGLLYGRRSSRPSRVTWWVEAKTVRRRSASSRPVSCCVT